MFTYADGSSVMVGDAVRLEYGNTPGTVELVVFTPAEMQEAGVEECGVMLLSPPFGRVYLPESSLRDDPLVLVQRGHAA